MVFPKRNWHYNVPEGERLQWGMVRIHTIGRTVKKPAGGVGKGFEYPTITWDRGWMLSEDKTNNECLQMLPRHPFG